NPVFLFGGRTLQIDSGASATWTGTNGIGIAGAAKIEIAGTFTANGGDVAGIVDQGAAGPVHIAPTGTFRKSAGPASLTISVPFDNDGTLEVSAGTLGLQGGDTGSTTGDF